MHLCSSFEAKCVCSHPEEHDVYGSLIINTIWEHTCQDCVKLATTLNSSVGFCFLIDSHYWLLLRLFSTREALCYLACTQTITVYYAVLFPTSAQKWKLKEMDFSRGPQFLEYTSWPGPLRYQGLHLTSCSGLQPRGVYSVQSADSLPMGLY